MPLLLSQTKYNWSLAAVDADIDGATQDMVAQCGAGGHSPNWCPWDTYEVVVLFTGAEMDLDG